MTNRIRVAAAVAAVSLAAAVTAVGAPAQAATARVNPGAAADLARLDDNATYSAFVHFGDSTPAARRLTLRSAGVTVLRDYDVVDAVYATGSVRGFERARTVPGVEYVESNGALRWLEDTAGWATGYEIARKPVAGGPYKTGGGAVIDGTGVAVGVLDSGADASHPDLGNVVSNWRFNCVFIDENDECAFPAAQNQGPGSNTDLVSGHGTFTTGLVIGDGTASKGTFTGAAPGAAAHVFGIGAGLHVLWLVEGLHHIYNHFSEITPAIRVINNSYGNGAGSPYDPDGIVEQLTNKLVADKGVTMVFAAGNDGGDGSEDRTSGYCKNPTPGVICVANYDDLGTGSLDGDLDLGSSRGEDGNPLTYPDISAPGSFVTSTCARTSAPLCDTPGLVTPAIAWEPHYGDATGTSASAPIVTGAAALLLQAKPTLTPAQVEDVLLDTARKFEVDPATGYEADPQNAGSTTSFDKGAGLLDVPAALSDARVGAIATGASTGTATIVSGDGGETTLTGATDIVSATATPGTDGVTYTVTVRDGADQGLLLLNSLRLFQNVAGVPFRTNINLSTGGAGAAPAPAEAPDDPATAEATSASRAGNVVTFFVPYAELGNPAAGAAAHNVWVGGYFGLIQDAAPGSRTGTGSGDLLLGPEYAAYTTR